MAQLKTYAGTYGADTTPEFALNDALLKYPEIARELITLYPRYSMTYLLERTKRYAAEKVLGDNSFEWKVMGRYNKPSIMVESELLTGKAAGDTLDLVFEHDTAAGTFGNFLNANDLVRFQSGATAVVVGAPKAATANAGGADYANGYATMDDSNTDYVAQVRLIGVPVAADVAAGAIVGTIGSAFGAGSTGDSVGENYVYPETRKNFLTLMRKKTTITGKDATDVTWIENNGSRLWYFTREQILMDEFMYQQELQRWYGQRSVTGTPSTYADSLSTADASIPVIGDGILAQIDGSNIGQYSGDLTENHITEFIGKLSLNAQNAEGNEWVVFTGTEGRIRFHKAMRDLMVASGAGGAGVLSDKAGKDISLGGNFTTYHALGNKITVAYCPVLDDAHVHSTTSGQNGFNDDRLKESSKMIFLDMGKTNGVANVELLAKGAEGINRSFVKKYVAGMVNPYDNKAMMAANGNDKFECHVLSESGIVVRNPLSCGILELS
jgi:hypothetical protein